VGLLAATLIMGCSERGGTPLSPDAFAVEGAMSKGGAKGGGGQPPSPITVSMASGMAADVQEVTVVAANKNRLELNTGGVASYVLTTALTNAANCVLEPASGDPSLLIAKLVDAFAGGRYLTLKVDKRSNGAPSAGHLLATTWTDAAGLDFSLWISNATVSWATGTGAYTFTGGMVKVRHDPGDPSGRTTLTCDNGDSVVLQIDGI